MNCKTLIELLLTAVIALFAGLTWLATSTYSYISGLTLFIHTNRDLVGINQGIDRPMAVRTMRALKKRFPKVYKDMRGCMNPGTRDDVEKEEL